MVRMTKAQALTALPTRPRRASRPWRVVRGRRTWWQRFTNPNELYPLKVTLLVTCLLIAAYVQGL